MGNFRHSGGGSSNGQVAMSPGFDAEAAEKAQKEATAVKEQAASGSHEAPDPPLYRSDDFRMYCMKVLPCSKRYCHDWTTCPFSHPGEKARRRDPRTQPHTGIACPDMKKEGSCIRGESCPYAHNVFEYWLHPTRYRTQLCNDGAGCRRRICFFAHSLDELRVPSSKPFVSPEALAASTATATADAVHKGGLGGALGGQGGLDNAAVHALLESLSQASGGSAHLQGASTDLAAQLAQLQAADGAHQQKQQEQQRVIRLLSVLLRDAYGQPPSPSGHSDSVLLPGGSGSLRPSLEVATSLSPSTHFSSSEDISTRSVSDPLSGASQPLNSSEMVRLALRQQHPQLCRDSHSSRGASAEMVSGGDRQATGVELAQQSLLYAPSVTVGQQQGLPQLQGMYRRTSSNEGGLPEAESSYGSMHRGSHEAAMVQQHGGMGYKGDMSHNGHGLADMSRLSGNWGAPPSPHQKQQQHASSVQGFGPLGIPAQDPHAMQLEAQLAELRHLQQHRQQQGQGSEGRTLWEGASYYGSEAASNAREAQLLMPPHFAAANGHSQPGDQPNDGPAHYHNNADSYSNGRTHYQNNGEHHMAPLDMQVDPRHMQGGRQARASIDSAASTLSNMRFSMDAASMGRSSMDAGTNGGAGFREGFAASRSLDGGYRTPGGPTGGASFLPGSPSAFGTLGSSLFAFRGV